MSGKGYIALAPGSHSYELGPSFYALSRRAKLGMDVVSLSRPIVERITAVTHESASFNLFRGGYLERVYGVDSPHILTYRMTPGTRFLLYSSSGGKAVLAALPADERERYLARVRLVPRTEATVKTVGELRRQIDKAIREGVAYSHGEHMAGVMSIAAAVRRRDGYPLGALNVAIPRIRYTPAVRTLCVRELKAAAMALEQELPEKLT